MTQVILSDFKDATRELAPASNSCGKIYKAPLISLVLSYSSWPAISPTS